MRILAPVLLVAHSHGSSCASAWSDVAPMPTARAGLGATAVDRVVFAMGGCNDKNMCLQRVLSSAEALDTRTGKWTSLPNMPTPRSSLGVIAVDGLVYALGGTNNSDLTALSTVEVFDPKSNTWDTKNSMPTARASFGTAVLDGKIYVAGGADGMDRFSSVVVYDPRSDSWSSSVAPMSAKRAGVAAVGSTASGLVYVMGGGGASKLVEVYDPTLDSWTTSKSPLPSGLDEPAAVSGGNGSVLIVGGSDGPNIVHDSWQLQSNGESSKWVKLQAEMHKSRASCGLAMVGGVMYAVGGFSNEPPVILANTASLRCN
jgi:N-acetylneuraminic acid mutarotase